MNRRLLFRDAALLAAGLAVPRSANPRGANPRVTPANNSTAAEARRRIQHTAAAGFAMERRDWEQGTLAQAFLEAGDDHNVILFTKAAIVQRAPDGRLAVVVEGGPTDPAMGGEAYHHAAQVTGDPQIAEAVQGLLDFLLHKAPRAPDGTLYHVFNAPEVWSDGFFSSPPFFAVMGQYDEALLQIEGFRKRLWDPRKKLLSHIYSDAPGAKNPQEFWGGGNGWAAAGLARVLRVWPAQRSADRQTLATFATELIDGCLACQRPDGLFYNVLDRPDTFLETNVAQMLAFAIYSGIRQGWLPTRYRAAADRMRNAARAQVDSFGFVQNVCGAPNFDKPGTSTEAQSFAIMMESASAKLA